MTRLLIHRLALVATGLIAFVAVESPHMGNRTFLLGTIGAAVLVAAFVNFLMRRGEVKDEAEARAKADHTFLTTKRVLMAMMAVGIAAFVGGRATLATFSAETSNLGSSAASGTLTMSNQVGAGSTCDSFGASSNADNTNTTCGVALTLQNLAPGSFAGSPAKITIKNTGSIDARSLYVFAPFASTTIATTAMVSGATASGATIAVAPIEGTFTVGDTLTISYGQNTQNCLVGGTSPVGAEGGATSLTLGTCTPATWNYAYPVGAKISDGSSDTGTTNTDCYDAQTTSSTVSGATFGTTPGLNFNEIPPATTAHTTPVNGMCTDVLMWIQEQSASGKNYCWYGNGSGGANGGCVAPISSTISNSAPGGTSISGSTTSLTVSAGLDGNVVTNDSLTISQGNTSITCKVGANAYIGDTSITVNTCGTGTFTLGTAKVIDSTTLNTLNSDTHTIQNFDTSAHWNAGQIGMYTVASNGGINNPSAIELNKHGDAGDTRIFYVGVYMPALSGSGQNTLQGLKATFGLAWHVDQ